MEHSAEFRRCLEQCDVAGMRRVSAHVFGHLPQPKTDHEALVSIHHARTQMADMAFKLRAYSHRWLLDNGYPSALPDELKPKAEREYPVAAMAVGISVNATSSILKPIVGIVRGAMEDAVQDAFADGRTDPSFVKARMREAKDRSIKQLVGALAARG